MTSAVYASNGLASGAAGGWGVPLVWVARVLAGMCDHNGAPYLSRAALELMATLVQPDCEHTKTAFGCAREPGPFHYKFIRSLGSPDPDPGARVPAMARIHHNGTSNGGSAFLMHQFPESPTDSKNRREDSLSICMAFNRGFYELGEQDGNAIFDILQRMEFKPLDRTFPDGDLFENV